MLIREILEAEATFETPITSITWERRGDSGHLCEGKGQEVRDVQNAKPFGDLKKNTHDALTVLSLCILLLHITAITTPFNTSPHPVFHAYIPAVYILGLRYLLDHFFASESFVRLPVPRPAIVLLYFQ